MTSMFGPFESMFDPHFLDDVQVAVDLLELSQRSIHASQQGDIPRDPMPAGPAGP